MSREHRNQRSRVTAVMLLTLGTLTLAYLQKLPCADGNWKGEQFRLLCFTDVVSLYDARGIAQGSIPYLEAPNEYPVLTAFAMFGAGTVSDSVGEFFNWTAALLGASAFASAWALAQISGRRALLFAAAPSLVLYAFLSWDLIAVFFATLATLAFFRGRDRTAGALLGLGAATKLYPALFLLPFALSRMRDGKRPVGLLVAAAVAWAAVNLPVALLAPRNWLAFFRFHSARAHDWFGLWSIPSRRLGFEWPTALLNGLSLFAFALLATWVIIRGLRSDAPSWELALPLLIVFLLTNKVYSPQYSLWLLPWFAIALPSLRLFAAFQAVDVAVFATGFLWFRELLTGDGLPVWPLELALILRAVVLVAYLLAWNRRVNAGVVLDRPLLMSG